MKLILSSALFLTSFMCSAQLTTSQNLKGNVKYIEEIFLTPTDPEDAIPDLQVENLKYFEYDTKGNLVTKTTLNSKKEIRHKEYYTYTKAGMPSTINSKDKNDVLLNREIMDYSPDDRLIKWTKTSTWGKVTNKYTKTYRYSFKNTFEYSYTITEETGVVVDSTIVTLNTNKTVSSEEKFFKGDFAFIKHLLVQYEYSANNKIATLIKSTVLDNNRTMYVMKDSNGNILETSSGNTNPIKYEYIFDKAGNWTSQGTYQNDELTSTTERKLVYY